MAKAVCPSPGIVTPAPTSRPSSPRASTRARMGALPTTPTAPNVGSGAPSVAYRASANRCTGATTRHGALADDDRPAVGLNHHPLARRPRVPRSRRRRRSTDRGRRGPRRQCPDPAPWPAARSPARDARRRGARKGGAGCAGARTAATAVRIFEGHGWSLPLGPPDGVRFAGATLPRPGGRLCAPPNGVRHAAHPPPRSRRPASRAAARRPAGRKQEAGGSLRRPLPATTPRLATPRRPTPPVTTAMPGPAPPPRRLRPAPLPRPRRRS